MNYKKMDANQLRVLITAHWEVLHKAKRGQRISPYALALFVEDHITQLWWWSEELRERLKMPKRQSNDSTWKGFVDVSLTSVEKETYGAWDIHDEDLWVLLVDAIGAGHKLSVTFNKQNSHFVASFTGQDSSKANEGFTLSAHAGDWYNAVRVLVYKHAVLLEGDWTAAAERVTDNIG